MGKVFDVLKDKPKDRPLDIHEYLVKNPASTFFMKMEGEGPEDSNIASGDMLVIDRSVTAKKGSLGVVIVDGELKVEKINSKIMSDNVSLWGVVVGLLRRL